MICRLLAAIISLSHCRSRVCFLINCHRFKATGIHLNASSSGISATMDTFRTISDGYLKVCAKYLNLDREIKRENRFLRLKFRNYKVSKCPRLEERKRLIYSQSGIRNLPANGKTEGGRGKRQLGAREGRRHSC